MDLIKVNKVKKYINNNDLKYSKGLEEEINSKLEHLLKLAIERAKSNYRSTLMRKDL